MVTEEDLEKAIVDLDYSGISGLVKEAIKSGLPPVKALNSLKIGLEKVGELYHKREYFLSELYMAGETMSVAMNVLTPVLSKDFQAEDEGIIVLGSIRGDIHDFGKNIIKTFLTAQGFNVHDLGVDVAPIRFVDEALKVNSGVIGVSAILSTTQPHSKEVVDELVKRGLREKIKVILGGTGVTKRAVKEYGVDAAVNNATEGINVIKNWLKES
jgi:methylmalonyl-CoA mutase cobalamin-binding domain/chain